MREMKFYRYYVIGFMGLVFAFLACLAVFLGTFMDVIYMVLFAVLMIPIGFLLEDTEKQLEYYKHKSKH